MLCSIIAVVPLSATEISFLVCPLSLQCQLYPACLLVLSALSVLAGSWGSAGCLSHVPNWGQDPLPRHVPCRGIEPTILHLVLWHPAHWAIIRKQMCWVQAGYKGAETSGSQALRVFYRVIQWYLPFLYCHFHNACPKQVKQQKYINKISSLLSSK